MATDEAKTVKLKTSDDQDRDVPYAVAKMNQTIATMIDDDCFEESDEGLPLSNVSAAVLDKVIEYCQQHKDDSPLSEEQVEEKRREEITGWDADFVKVPQNELFELILAANFLDNKPLLDLTCKKVAFMIRGKTPEEIRKTFNIENDFTPKEEEQVREENHWVEEKPWVLHSSADENPEKQKKKFYWREKNRKTKEKVLTINNQKNKIKKKFFLIF